MPRKQESNWIWRQLDCCCTFLTYILLSLHLFFFHNPTEQCRAFPLKRESLKLVKCFSQVDLKIDILANATISSMFHFFFSSKRLKHVKETIRFHFLKSNDAAWHIPLLAQQPVAVLMRVGLWWGGDLVLKWVPVCVGGVWLDKRHGSVGEEKEGGDGGRRRREEGALNGLKVQTNSRLERRCHVSALTSKRRLSEPRPRLAVQPLRTMCLSFFFFFFWTVVLRATLLPGLKSLSVAAWLHWGGCHPYKGVYSSNMPHEWLLSCVGRTRRSAASLRLIWPDQWKKPEALRPRPLYWACGVAWLPSS